jgi:two-component system chemotaxis response regulator CheY
MPQMDGVALTRSIKQDDTLRSIPVIMLTTEASEQERRNSLAAGVAAYLTKPVAQARLTKEVKRVLAEFSQ